MLFKRRAAERPLRLYYASDVHGSRLCWKKFINAGVHYPADVMIMGGDLTGKAIVPIVDHGDETFTAEVVGESRHASTLAELEDMRQAISTNGFYPVMADTALAERLRTDPAAQAEAFETALLEELRAWVEIADERLEPSERVAYVIPGNDDPWEIDAVLERGSSIDMCDGQIRIVNGHELLSLGFANRTPWQTPRELDEDELYARLRALADQLERPSTAVFNIHVPPHGTGLDTAFEVDADLRYVLKGGRPHEVATGSTAVRQIIEEVQPLVSLHGHIHESKNAASIGRTLAINPGSDYSGGVLDGCLVDLAGDRVLAHYLVSG